MTTLNDIVFTEEPDPVMVERVFGVDPITNVRGFVWQSDFRSTDDTGLIWETNASGTIKELRAI